VSDIKWCMCEELGKVARDGKSTCGNCGGRDAYGGSKDRPRDKRKTLKGASEEGSDGMREKTLHNSDVSGARKNVPDIRVVGDGDMFQLLCKASSQDEGWMKSTKAMQTPSGCVVQVTTQQRNADGSYAVAEALTFVPGVEIIADEKHEGGRVLVATRQ